MIKIISGKYKGSNLYVPEDFTRPTTNRVRKVLFDVIYDRVPSASVLDGFAGSGACGIEALSIGAREVVFLEQNKPAFDVLQKNINKLKINDCVSAKCTNFFTFRSDKKFDLIILDPPYSVYDISRLLKHSYSLAKPGTIIVYETNSSLDSTYSYIKTKTLGAVKLYFFMV